MLESVQGVEGGLKYDPNSGGFVATGPIIQEFDAQKSFLLPTQCSEPVTQEPVSVHSVSCNSSESLAIKLEEDGCCFPNSHEEEVKKQNISFMPQRDSKPSAIDFGSCQPTNHGTIPQSCPENAFGGLYLAKEGDNWDRCRNNLNLENSDYRFVSQSSSSLAVADEMDTIVDGDHRIAEYTQHTSSSMTDSSNGSGSNMHGCASSSQRFEEQRHPKVTSRDENESQIIVKATYKEDTIRFKLEPSVGCFQLYEEIAKRFKLQTGTFQLKYLDDEEEWVMLMSDADLQECLEILDDIGTRSVKFLVRDTPFGVGSSGSSNCCLAGGL